MDSALRPRDIQARIRAGESPEAVAAAAQTTVERIMAFATPVLAERAHIADRALRSSVRRRAGEGPARLLGDAVAERLRTLDVDADAAEWDAWRRDDGRWAVVVQYRGEAGARRAEFAYDVPGRYVVAEDDEARLLVGERDGRRTEEGGGRSGRRLTAVSLEDQELPLGADAIDLVREAPAADPRTPEDASDPAAEDAPEPAAETGEPSSDDEAGERPRPGRKPAKRSRGRASVPSWDEIMFGGGKPE